MRLTVIGCSGSYAAPASSASAYVMGAPAPGPADGDGPFRRRVDLGSGARGALQRPFAPLEADAALTSPLPARLFFDPSGSYVLPKYRPAGPQPKLPTW